MIYKKGTRVLVAGNTFKPIHRIAHGTIAVVAEDCDSDKNGNAIMVNGVWNRKGVWNRNPEYRIDQYVNIWDLEVLSEKTVKKITYSQAVEIIDGGESAFLCFPSNWDAIQFVEWLRERRPVDKEREVFRCGAKQLYYALGECVGMSIAGYDSGFYSMNAEVKASTFYDVVRKTVIL